MNTFWLKNVLLETGYKYEDDVVTETETAQFHLFIEDGTIQNIISANEDLPAEASYYDACGLLVLPSFAEMHIHLNKTYYGGPWKAPTPNPSVFKRIAEEQKLLPEQLRFVKERAKKILNQESSSGTTFVRTHCNIDHSIGLHHLELTMEVLTDYKNKLDGEIVAFPQHGLLRNHAVSLMKEALRTGASLVGGLDPATVDGDIEKSLFTMMDLAVEFNVDIDMHLHDDGSLGTYTMKRLAQLTEEAGWHNRVTISHAFGLGAVSSKEAEDLAETFAALGIRIASTIPVDIPGVPVPLLQAKGVEIQLGTDSLTDHWDPFGTGDMLDKANILAQRFRWIDEKSLGQALPFITKGKCSLDCNGKQQWPRIGDRADFILIKASSAAEVIARKPNKRIVFYKGQSVAGELPPVKMERQN
ncbi:amidohydrolase [Ectobacillus sp. JY-23]|uniref:amidohydrolase n=1 Tax=Ectobacillus sp. JY-23 TaxID=2933872 RepID=UPI001FF32211|nr:amidohydrolase [Ectobacillus sp. JY-23]UOY91858.1 amidohydrolase [Ectobacillus sp. JY-23]